MEELPLNIWSHIHASRRVVPKHLPHLSLFLLRTAFIWPFTFSKKQLGTYCSMLKPERVRILIGIFIFAGLWHVCMNGYFDMRHQYETRFYGCKHIRLEEYEIIQDEIQKRKLLSFLFLQTVAANSYVSAKSYPHFSSADICFWWIRTILSSACGRVTTTDAVESSHGCVHPMSTKVEF